MSLEIPDFSGSECKLLVVCGSVETDDKELVSWIKTLDKGMSARVKAIKDAPCIQLIPGRHPKDPKRVHIEIATKKFFYKPAKKSKLAEIQKALSRLEGHKVAAEIDGYYEVAVPELPPLIRSSMEESTADGVSIRMIKGTLAVRGAPIHRIDWWIGGKDDGVLIHLQAKSQTTIDRNYLMSALVLVDSAFRAFIQGKR